MKKIFFLLSCLLALPLCAQESHPRDPESCTSIMVGKKASTDGSVITSHTCDSWYRTWATIVPAHDYANDTIMSIYDGRMHTEFVTDQTGIKEKGQIPQVKHTYRFLDTAYPCLNEKQLGMGETTITGRRELKNPNGMFMIEELERVALQRCTTAREAIQLMGELIKQYGYADSGECLTIADPQEVWIFEVFGEGPDKIGGVWAAQRINDDEVGVSANIPRIGTLDLQDKDHYMASENVYEAAKRLKLWDGKEAFKFWKAYGGPNRQGAYKNYSVREFFIMSTLAPSKGYTQEMDELPVSFKPDRQISAEDVIRMLSQTYEGTPFENTKALMVEQKDAKTGETSTIKSPAANPWMRADEVAMLKAIAADKDAIQGNRLIAVPQCAYSTVIQLRSWLPDAVGGVCWFCLDNPGQSPRFPIFCGTQELPKLFDICGNHRYRDDTALWHYRQANKLATVRWANSRKDLEANRNYFLHKGMVEMQYVEDTYKRISQEAGEEHAQGFLTNYTADFVGATLLRWDEMTRKFWNDNRFGF